MGPFVDLWWVSPVFLFVVIHFGGPSSHGKPLPLHAVSPSLGFVCWALFSGGAGGSRALVHDMYGGVDFGPLWIETPLYSASGDTLVLVSHQARVNRLWFICVGGHVIQDDSESHVLLCIGID